MKQKLIQTVVTDMFSYLNNAQTEKLQEVLLHERNNAIFHDTRR